MLKAEEFVKIVKEMKKLESKRFILGAEGLKVRVLITLKRITKDYFEMILPETSFPVTLRDLENNWSIQKQFELA